MWAFGCVLFEMLTGHRAFDGDTMSEIIASVLKSEPSGALPADTPSGDSTAAASMPEEEITSCGCATSTTRVSSSPMQRTRHQARSATDVRAIATRKGLALMHRRWRWSRSSQRSLACAHSGQPPPAVRIRAPRDQHAPDEGVGLAVSPDGQVVFVCQE